MKCRDGRGLLGIHIVIFVAEDADRQTAIVLGVGG